MQRFRIILAGILMLCLVVIAIGCGDDDDITASGSPPAYIDAEISLQPNCHFYGEVHFNGGLVTVLDSVTVGDSLGSPIVHPYWGGANPHFSFEINEDGDDYMFTSGDNVEVVFYGHGKTSYASVTVLDHYDDIVSIVSPQNQSTVSQGVPLTFIWHKVEPAEWYGLYYSGMYDSLGKPVEFSEYTYAMDTTYTFAADQFMSSLDHILFNVISCTGPDPRTTTGNITGDYAIGKVFSYSDFVSLYIYGEGVDKKRGVQDQSFAQMREDVNPRGIIQKIYDQAR
ncbi:MAG: hypothetical protein JW763_02765 [candidate division Zixibacteria bacterium]|nr:hypothetical protein [candidate division Zixibacteria bacterium]